MIGLAFMVVLTFLYFSEMGIKKVLIFWSAYLGCIFLPLIGIPPFVANLIGYGVIAGYYITAKTS